MQTFAQPAQPAPFAPTTISRPTTQDPSQLRAQAAAVDLAASRAGTAGPERLVIAGDEDVAACTPAEGLNPPAAALLHPQVGIAAQPSQLQRPLTAGPAVGATQPTQMGSGTSATVDGFSASTGLAQAVVPSVTGAQAIASSDAPWRARAAWLQAQTNGDPAADLYKSSIPLGRNAGMGGAGGDTSAYQESYGKDAAALARSTAKEAVARKAQVSFSAGLSY